MHACNLCYAIDFVDFESNSPTDQKRLGPQIEGQMQGWYSRAQRTGTRVQQRGKIDVPVLVSTSDGKRWNWMGIREKRFEALS